MSDADVTWMADAVTLDCDAAAAGVALMGFSETSSTFPLRLRVAAGAFFGDAFSAGGSDFLGRFFGDFSGFVSDTGSVFGSS